MTRSLGTRGLLVVLAGLSCAALLARLRAAGIVGFGDSEALYAAYALHPAPAYLDHPGLIGLVSRFLGGGGIPHPREAHLVTSIASTVAPWVMVVAARAVGGTARGSLVAGIVTLAAPEVAVGLFGMTPDLLMFFAWVVGLGAFGRALTRPPGSAAAAAWFTTAGIAIGVACASKVSGLTLGLACGVSLLSSRGREHARTLWPWAAAALALFIFLPVVRYESAQGWPMLEHRLVDTQHDAGVSARNGLAVMLGQAGYLSPLLFAAAIPVARSLYRQRKLDAVHGLLAAAAFVPAASLGALCLWSRVAEPHWLAPAWLALPLYLSLPGAFETSAFPGPRFRVASVVTGLVLSACVYAWVLVPGLVALVPERDYDPRLDLANELYGWPRVAADVRELVESLQDPMSLPEDTVVVGPVWMECAQLRDALPLEIPVGCVGKDVADFARWSPARITAHADLVVFVHDNRAPADSGALFPDRTKVRSQVRTVTRGGRVARVFTIEVLARRAAA